jgi:hypothetical protein
MLFKPYDHYISDQLGIFRLIFDYILSKVLNSSLCLQTINKINIFLEVNLQFKIGASSAYT